MNGQYNLDFVFNECGFDWLGPDINRALLLNVSYCFRDRSLKLYIHDSSREFVYKIDQSRTITRQYRGDSVGAQADPARLSKFLADTFDYDDVLIDAVEGDTFYLLIENSSASQYIKLLDRLCLKYAFPKSRVVDTVNRINSRAVGNIFECFTRRAISMIKIPMGGGEPKFYARPFLTGNGFDLPDDAERFLCRLYDCQPRDLKKLLRYSWISTGVSSDRIVLATHPAPTSP